MCCLWRTIRRFVKPNYPMTTKLAANRTVPCKVPTWEIALSSDDSNISHMPHVGEFIGEWVDYPMQQKPTRFFITAASSAMQNQESIQSATRHLLEMVRAESVLAGQGIYSPKWYEEQMEKFYENRCLCTTCSGQLPPFSKTESDIGFFRCVCSEFEFNLYWSMLPNESAQRKTTFLSTNKNDRRHSIDDGWSLHHGERSEIRRRRLGHWRWRTLPCEVLCTTADTAHFWNPDHYFDWLFLWNRNPSKNHIDWGRPCWKHRIGTNEPLWILIAGDLTP